GGRRYLVRVLRGQPAALCRWPLLRNPGCPHSGPAGLGRGVRAVLRLGVLDRGIHLLPPATGLALAATGARPPVACCPRPGGGRDRGRAARPCVDRSSPYDSAADRIKP